MAALFLRVQVVTGRVMGPMARRLGLIATGAGLLLFASLQVGCELTGS